MTARVVAVPVVVLVCYRTAMLCVPDIRAFQRRWAWRLLVVEALACLALASLALRVLTFRRLAPWLGPRRLPGAGETGGPLPTPEQRTTLLRVGAAVRRAARALPWEAVCLPRAVAAKMMLSRRQVSGTLHLGAKGAGTATGMTAHAWLSVGPVIVTGGAERPGHAELVRFG